MDCKLNFESLRKLTPLQKYNSKRTLEVDKFLKQVENQFLYQKHQSPHDVSTLYVVFSSASSSESPAFEQRREIEDETWPTISDLVHRGSQLSKLQEQVYKILEFWYWIWVLRFRNRFHSTAQCWRSDADFGDYLHSLWSCPVIQPFWEMECSAISRVTDVDLPFTAQVLLLSQLPLSLLQNSVFFSLLHAALSLMDLHWTDGDKPSLATWLQIIEEICTNISLFALAMAGDLSAVSSLAKKCEDKECQIRAYPTTLTVRFCDLSGTDYMGQTFMLDYWQNMFLPKKTKMEVLGAVDNYFGLQLVILVAEDGRVFAYEEESMFLLSSSLPELMKNGTNKKSEIYRLQKSKASYESVEEIQRLTQETEDYVNSHSSLFDDMEDFF